VLARFPGVISEAPNEDPADKAVGLLNESLDPTAIGSTVVPIFARLKIALSN